MRHRGQIINHFFPAHIGVHHDVAKRLYLQHALIGDIAAFDGVTDTAAAHHAKISAGSRHLRSQQQVPHIGLHETDFATVAFEARIDATDFHVELRFTFILERRQQRKHLLIFNNLRGVEYALTFTVVPGHFFLQINGNELVVNHFHFAVTELKVRPAHVFPPLVGLYNPDPILLIWRTRRTRYVINLLLIFLSHTHRILRVATDNHRQRTCWQAARHFDIARGVRAVVAVVIMSHMGGRDNDVWLFPHIQFLNNQFGFISRFTEFDIGKELRVANFRRIVSG